MILHFAHANGFPAGSYKAVFNALPEDVRVIALEKFAHSANFPVSDNWERQADELLEYIQSQSQEAIYAVGHSFGAIISYIAASKKPDLFKGVIMLDPPLISGFMGRFVDLIRGTQLFDRVTPAKLASTRCTSWQLDTDLTAYFQQKGLFRNMRKECIQDYVSSAIAKKDGQYRLTFDNQVEADVFRTIPTQVHRKHGVLSLPGLLVTGSDTKVCRPRQIRSFLNANQFEHQVVSGGGHMFPLENPKEVAAIIANQIKIWEQQSN